MLGNSSILSVKDLNQLVKDMLTDAIGQIWLVGEISNFSKPSSGHWYFTLKDEAAQIRCAMFRNSNFKTGLTPQNGQQVLVRANVTLYEARGEYQLVIDKLQLAGVGTLQQQFEELKKKLQNEGLFDSCHKNPLPKPIGIVGIITSPTGAALQDICQILKRRDPNLSIIIYPTLVQGNEAGKQIANMIEIANKRQECDILIVGRGGGSLEDLWAFNEEIVAKAIFNSQLPIISAVGHETDFTIADFVADLRAATPSAAAEIISQDKQEKFKQLQNLTQHLNMAMDYFIMQKSELLQKIRHQLQLQHPQVKLAKQQTQLVDLICHLTSSIEYRLSQSSRKLNFINNQIIINNPEKKILSSMQQIKQQEQRAIHVMTQILATAKHHFHLKSTQLHTVSPLATLARGYSVTMNDKNQAVYTTKDLQIGDILITQLQSGRVISKVTTIEKISHKHSKKHH